MLKEERGVSIPELLGIIAVLGIVLALMSGIFLSIVKTTTIQGQKVEMQQTANNLVVQLEKISKIDGIYEQAGYLGKFVGIDWKQAHIFKPLVQENGSDEWVEMSLTGQGANQVALTDINDTLNQSKEMFKIKDPAIKIKILQQKNENEVTKTLYGTPNYRDTFSIQTTVMILFYKEEINFTDYYQTSTGYWKFEEIKQHPNVVYSREAMFYYRDDAKSKGEIPGNGRW